MPEQSGRADPLGAGLRAGVRVQIGGNILAVAQFHGDLDSFAWRALVLDIDGDSTGTWQQGPNAMRIVEPGHRFEGLEALVFVEGPEIIGRCPFS